MRLAVRSVFNIKPEFTDTDVLLFRIFSSCCSAWADGEWWSIRYTSQIFQAIKALPPSLLQDLNEFECWVLSKNWIRSWRASNGIYISRQSCFQFVFLVIVYVEMSITLFILFQKKKKKNLQNSALHFLKKKVCFEKY